MPLKTGAPRGVIVCNRAFNIRKIGARVDGIYCQWDFFPYSVLICAKSRLRGFRSTEIHAARAVSAISAVQAVARSSTSNTIQAVARNKRSRSGSAQSAQSQRQCAVGVARAENSALRTFRAIFFERQCVWRWRQCAPINKKPFQETTRARAPPENNCPFF